MDKSDFILIHKPQYNSDARNLSYFTANNYSFLLVHLNCYLLTGTDIFVYYDDVNWYLPLRVTVKMIYYHRFSQINVNTSFSPIEIFVTIYPSSA